MPGNVHEITITILIFMRYTIYYFFLAVFYNASWMQVVSGVEGNYFNDVKYKNKKIIINNKDKVSVVDSFFLTNSNKIINIAFEDEKLDHGLRGFISDDISSVFSHLVPILYHERGVTSLQFEGEGRVWPDALNGLGRIRHIDNEPYLIVSKNISDKYVEKIMSLKEVFDKVQDFKEEKNVIINYFRKINHKNFSLKEFDINKHVCLVSDTGLSKKDAVDNLKLIPKGFLKSLGLFSFSEIDFRGGKNLSVECLRLEEKDGIFSYSEKIYFIFTEGSWKIVL